MVNTKKKILFTLLIIILALSIVASTGLMLPNRDSDILGIAYLDGPLVGATVMVYGSSGNIIAEFPNSTYDSDIHN